MKPTNPRVMQDTESFYTIVQAELGLEGQLKPEDFITEREEMLRTMFPEAKLLPGVAELIQHLKDNNVRPIVTQHAALAISAPQY
jgi:beta-phosphoglucomutase-like phosphatase (HAD superfamily)